VRNVQQLLRLGLRLVVVFLLAFLRLDFDGGVGTRI
jgi:hypothetical protein